MRRGRLAPFVVLVACAPRTSTPPDAMESTSESVPPASSDVSMTGGLPAGKTTSFTGSETTSSSDEGFSGFIQTPDGGDRNIECSLWDQDCPPGEKCAAWANDGGGAWNATRCVPVVPNASQVGEHCTTEDLTSGVDTCDLGSTCWDVDTETGEGRCVANCIGPPEAPTCEDDGSLCHIGSNSTLALCFPPCDPLDPQACPEGQGCYLTDQTTTCAPDASGRGGGVFEPCAFVNVCNPGLFCANAPDVPSCSDASGCCTPFCDLSTPQCPDTTSCVPVYADGTAPPALEHLGACIQEKE